MQSCSRFRCFGGISFLMFAESWLRVALDVAFVFAVLGGAQSNWGQVLIRFEGIKDL